MNVYLQQSFDWVKKWFLGSSSTLIGTFFFGDTIATRLKIPFGPIYWSVLLGFIAVIVTFIGRLIYLLVKDVKTFSVKNKEYVDEIAQLTDSLAKKPDLQRRPPKLFIRSEIKYNAYGEAILKLKDAFAFAHGLRKEEQITGEKIAQTMIFLCEKLKSLFEEDTHKKYSVCIKILKQNNGNYDHSVVQTLFSDEASMRHRKPHYNKSIVLANDICYEHIRRSYHDPGSFYYLNNKIPSDMSYYSSFFETYPWSAQPATLEDREKNWTLPYKSEFVVPIYPLHSKGTPFDKKSQVRGFLCVDCNQTDGFSLHYDGGMLQGVADGIYDLVANIASE